MLQAAAGVSPSSVVKMEANRKARKKEERQGLLGEHRAAGAIPDLRPTALTMPAFPAFSCRGLPAIQS